MSVLCQPMLDVPPEEVHTETRVQKLDRLQKELEEWKSNFSQQNGRNPTRQDMLTDSEASSLFLEFAALRK